MAVRYKFVNLTINGGKSMGIRNGRAFLEGIGRTQKRRDGVMISLTNTDIENLDAPLTSAQLASSYQSAEINIRNNANARIPIAIEAKGDRN